MIATTAAELGFDGTTPSMFVVHGEFTEVRLRFDTVDLGMEFGEMFEIEIPDRVAANIRSIDDLRDWLRDKF